MSEQDEFSKLNSVKECPVCGRKLVKGYFTIPRGTGVFHSDTYDNAPALRCERCGIAILDYEVVTRAHTPGSFLKKCVKCDESIPIASEYCPKCGTYQKEKKEEP
jgi:ssDNA-binding Zn-finger/Zn-ribbon topoisomerase 1